MKDADELLQISSFSLKAIHVTSHRVRALVMQQLGHELTAIEASALGGCISTKLTKDSKFVSPLVGMVGYEQDKEIKTKQEHECDRKFTMSWSSFKTAKRDWMRKQRAQGEGTALSRSLSSASPTSAPVSSAAYAPFDVRWMYCADGGDENDAFL